MFRVNDLSHVINSERYVVSSHEVIQFIWST